MKEKIEAYYLKQQEPVKSCLLTLRDILLNLDRSQFTEEWKYGLPFFYYRKKPFCYFWKDPKSQQPYIGYSKGYLISHPQLIKGNRTRIKILPIDPNSDIPIHTLRQLFELSIVHYK